MRIGRVIKWSSLAALVVIVATAIILYIQASRPPEEYRPALLAFAQREQAAQELISRLSGEEFNGQLERRVPFTWTVTAEDLNRYVASVEEVAYLSNQASEPEGLLAGAGFADPAIALGDGVLTLMGRSVEYDKVLSADLVFEFDAQGDLRTRLQRVRVGRLTVPQTLLEDALARLREDLAEQRQQAQAGQPNRDDRSPTVTEFLFAAAEGQAVAPVFKAFTSSKRGRIRTIDITPEALTLHVEPVQRD